MILRIIEQIERLQSFLITSHVRPDGDALGSELALYHILRDMGKEVMVYNRDRTPANYLFLPGTRHIVHDLPDPERFDCLVVLDCSDLRRVGDQAPRIGGMKKIINIDHHVSNGGFCELAYIDGDASSTGEMLYRLIVRMGVLPSSEVANNLYAAIITDTGGFRYRSTTKDTLLAAGNLVGYGADPQWISENIYENTPMEKVHLLTEALKTLTFHHDGQVASIVVSLDDFSRVGALSEHIEGFVDIPRTIQGVKVSVFFQQMSENNYKLSFRSKNSVNVEQVARKFGGGGHLNAAACNLEGTLAEVDRRVMEAIGEVL